VFYLNKDIIMIKNCTKFVLTVSIGLSLFSGLSQAMFLKKGAYDRALLIPNPSAPARLGALALIHNDEQGFSVLRESGEINEIPNHLVAKDLRGISQDEVKARLDDNIAFRVQQGSDGEFSLQEGGGLEGGGPILAAVFYWTVKGVGYAGLGAAIVAGGILGSRATPSGSQNSSTTNGGVTGAAVTGAIANSGAIAAIETAAGAAGAVGMGIFSP
jgi:hypothetical protein